MLKIGFKEVNVNPPLGIAIHVYYVPRFAKGILDDITSSAMVFDSGDKKIALISVDCCALKAPVVKKCTMYIQKSTGISRENIFMTATHTHTGPYSVADESFDMDKKVIEEYADFLCQRITDAVKLAIEDMHPARMGFAEGHAPDRVAYIRRYKMKDGTTMTCPPINDPNIDYPIGSLDSRVNILRFDREGAETIVIVNFGLHADTVNGELLSADWPYWMKKTLDNAIGNVRCIFLPGAQGDVGSTNVNPSGGDMNDTEISFDNEMKSPGMARFVGRALAGTVLQVYDKVKYTDTDTIDIISKNIKIPANVPSPEDMPRAREYKRLHDEGRDDLIPYTAMELTTVVAEALRMCRMENGPKEFDMVLTGLRIGNTAFVGIPGEPFTDIGVMIKETDGWDMILPCGLTNGYEGYFPTREAYAEGGYEARTSPFRPEVTDILISKSKELLEELSSALTHM